MTYESNSTSSNPFHCTAPSPELCSSNCGFSVLIPVHPQLEHITVKTSLFNAKISSETSIHHFTSNCVKEKDKCWKMIVEGKQKSVSQKYKNNKSMKIMMFTISSTKIITKYTHVLIYACESSLSPSLPLPSPPPLPNTRQRNI